MPHKICPDCGRENGVRSFKCKGCSHEFPVKFKKTKKFVPADVDWKTLEKGDIVKILVGYGPYHDSLDNEGKPKRVYLGCQGGQYVVDSIDKSGFYVLDGYTKSFVYMGATCEGLVGIKEAHKIKLIRRKSYEKNDS